MPGALTQSDLWFHQPQVIFHVRFVPGDSALERGEQLHRGSFQGRSLPGTGHYYNQLIAQQDIW
jgi:hypothetical protein